MFDVTNVAFSFLKLKFIINYLFILNLLIFRYYKIVKPLALHIKMLVLQNFIDFVLSIPEISIQEQIIFELDSSDILNLLHFVHQDYLEPTELSNKIVSLLKSVNLFKRLNFIIAFNNFGAWSPRERSNPQIFPTKPDV